MRELDNKSKIVALTFIEVLLRFDHLKRLITLAKNVEKFSRRWVYVKHSIVIL